MPLLQPLADYFGSDEPGLRLVISLFLGYPLAIIYRSYLHKKDPFIQHLFCTIVGIIIIYWNYGVDVIHSMICIGVAYLLIKFVGGLRSVIAAFIFFMTYLVVGYAHTATDSYDIKWTMPHCILTLRLIGLVTDVYDGKKPKEELAKDQVESAISDHPSLLEIAAYSYFFGGTMVGPQFPLTRFRRFINGEFSNKTGGPPDSIYWCLLRLAPGVVYLVAHQYLIRLVPTDWFLTDDFLQNTFFMRVVYAMCWYRVMLFKYQSAWLIVEGVCILTGLAYNGIDAKGRVRWDAVRNIRLRKFEFGYTFYIYVECFNVNTNQWVAKYVFKRLKFLGNKDVSQLSTLFFLAIWHGLYTGYFACFFFEFFCLAAERNVSAVLRSRYPKFCDFCTSIYMKPLYWICYKLLSTFGCTFGLLPFCLLSFERWFPVYKHFYFYGWILMIPIAQGFCVLLKRMVPRASVDEGKKEL